MFFESGEDYYQTPGASPSLANIIYYNIRYYMQVFIMIFNDAMQQMQYTFKCTVKYLAICLLVKCHLIMYLPNT